MSIVFDRQDRKKRINDTRRDNKKMADMLKNRTQRNEMKVVFDALYRDQVSALYRKVKNSKW